MKLKGKKTKYAAVGIAALFIFCYYCGGNKGTVTIVNTTLNSVNINFNDKNVALQPEQHFTQKGLKPGTYLVKIGADNPLTIQVDKMKTTLIDVSGDNCFVVADYTDQYDEKGGGTVKIIEKFVNQKTFTPANKITAQIGEYLPEMVQGHKRITRLHRIDCSWIDNDQAIVDAIANLP